MKPIEAYAYYIYNDLDELEIIELANYWLENDKVTDSFCQLCYVDTTNREDIFELFEAGCLEFNVTEQTLIEAGLVRIRRTLNQTILHEADAFKAIEYIDKHLHYKMSESLEKEFTGTMCSAAVYDNPEKNFREEGSGINFNLTQLFGWEREIQDCISGSYLNFYADIPREKAELKMYEHLVIESKKWLESDKVHNNYQETNTNPCTV